MMRELLTGIFLFGLSLFPITLVAQPEPLAILEISASALSNATGGAAIGLHHSAGAFLNNPATLTNTPGFIIELNTAHWPLYEAAHSKQNLQSVVATYSANRLGYFGLAYRQLRNELAALSPDIRKMEWVLTLGYARRVSRQVALGINYKRVFEQSSRPVVINQIGELDFAATQLGAVDFGIQIDNLLPELTVVSESVADNAGKETRRGIAVAIGYQHIGPSWSHSGYGSKTLMPQRIQLAWNWHLLKTAEARLVILGQFRKHLFRNATRRNFLAALISGWDLPLQEDLETAIGAELTVFQLFALRWGLLQGGRDGLKEYDPQYQTVGFSIGLPAIRVNIAMLLPSEEGHPLENTIFTGISVAL